MADSDTLIWHIKNGELDSVKTRLEKEQNFDVNGAIAMGRGPIHYAADYGQEKVLEYLLEKGANPNLPDKHGITPLLAAIWEEHVECVELLIKKGARKDGKSPSGESYAECTENETVKELLK